jgi:Holliday junction resolvasome RuvABC endonuclease subunit
VLAIDPGFAIAGWALVRLASKPKNDWVSSVGLIRTSSDAKKRHVLQAEDNIRRTREVIAAIRKLRRANGVCAICIEAFSPVRSSGVAAKLGHVYGAIAAYTEFASLPLIAASPQQVKRAVLGKQSGSEEEMEKALAKYAPTNMASLPKSMANHAWDAIGVFIACRESDVMLALRR